MKTPGDTAMADSCKPGFEDGKPYGQACIDTLTRPADGEFVMVPAGWVIERTAANEVRVTCEGDVSVMAREGGAYSGSLAEYALYGLVSDMLSAAPQQSAEAVAEYQYRMPEAHDDSWHRMTREEYEASLATGHCCGIASWTKNFELRKLYTTPPPAIDIGKLRGAVETLNHAIATQLGARVTIHATRARQIRDELAALIGDGEEN